MLTINYFQADLVSLALNRNQEKESNIYILLLERWPKLPRFTKVSPLIYDGIDINYAKNKVRILEDS